MNAPLRQMDRLGRLTTALGPDVLVLLRFDGTEQLNDLFEYRVEALATRSDLDFDALVGTHATVEIEGREGIRAFDGIVTQARWAGWARTATAMIWCCARGSGWPAGGATSASFTTRP
ncbi:contractile injection system protein, VgrG/Pvc8 family [Paracoccus cavernae]|uniref:Contractile injection system protein, VgrG/Pvc8 family n=1 Tax=Paracoccus cavernae TaxID=1571207 RepID=A0ABT8D592_9RHOB|nr:contractile injection system protein, VgrG/Pvc8 family [Paracoccus cavernae]